MVLESMNFQEIINERKKDSASVHDYFVKNLKSNLNKYKRLLLKRYKDVDFPVCIDSKRITLKSKNHYIISVSVEGYKGFKRLEFLHASTMYYHGPGGLWALTHDDTGGYHFYCPHLFDRYRERFLKDGSVDKLSVIDAFMKYNYAIIDENQCNSKYPDGVYGVVADGLLLGIRESEDIIVWKTFVSNEMLKGLQIDKTINGQKLINRSIDCGRLERIVVPIQSIT